MISMIIPEGYRWYSMHIQRNSLASNFNKLFSNRIRQIYRYSLLCTKKALDKGLVPLMLMNDNDPYGYLKLHVINLSWIQNTLYVLIW